MRQIALGAQRASVGGSAAIDADTWYAGYEQVVSGVSDASGRIISASLASGQTFENFMQNDPMGVARTIVTLGDSLTQSGYPTVLASISGRTVINLGRGSHRSNQIAARMGAVAVLLTVSGDEISAGSNSVTHTNGVAIAGGNGSAGSNQFISRADSNTTDSVTGQLGSVHGTLTRTASGGPPSTTETYTFVPDADAILPAGCPPGTPFIADNPYRDYTHVIWAGSNDLGYGDALTTIEPMVQAMIDSLGHRRFIVLNPINRTGQVDWQKDGTWWDEVMAVEAMLAKATRDRFVNIRRMMIDQGLSRAELSPEGDDADDIAADTIPSSLKSDFIHHNSTGNEVIAEIVNDELDRRGI